MILTKKYKSQEYPLKIDVFSWKWWNGVVSLELGLKISFFEISIFIENFPRCNPKGHRKNTYQNYISRRYASLRKT